MTFSSQQQLLSRLDLLASKGRHKLLCAVTIGAHRKALPYFFWGLLPAALITFLLNVLHPGMLRHSWSLWLTAALALPCIAYLARFAIDWFANRKVTRAQSLALYDAQLQLSDRLQTADEFVVIEQPTGFQQAAIADARSAIVRAIGFKLHDIEIAKISIPLTAKLLAIFAVLLQFYLVLNIGVSTLWSAPDLLSRSVTTQVGNVSAGIKLTPITASATQVVGLVAEPHHSTRAASRESTPRMSSQIENSKGSNSANGAVSAGGNGEAGPSGREMPTALPTLESKRPNADQLPTAHQSSSLEGDSRGGQQPEAHGRGSYQQAENTKVNASTGEQEKNTTDEQAKQGEMSGNQNMGQQRNTRAKKEQDQNKKDQQQGSGNQQDSNSQNSSTQGDNSQKKSRGINQLMLAVPMEDQFVGTPGPGPEQHSVHLQQPGKKTTPVIPNPSEARGQAQGGQPAQPERMLQPWEVKLLSQFYQKIHADDNNKVQ
ncbi:hypothetical protein [Shewanella fodinae]|uniref:Uncharacterized protein n=1 Tax=Shewanella fodinae TaxID=552357 RepID=A0A4R2FDN4_9GAMM|nr:hypothetical protein [Shewanella fodinae]MDN5369620.1 hypothetical protein [Shewanella sp.]TCN82818.1 hypothetical protein EDC91_11737 [Shewanella fodinae]